MVTARVCSLGHGNRTAEHRPTAIQNAFPSGTLPAQRPVCQILAQPLLYMQLTQVTKQHDGVAQCLDRGRQLYVPQPQDLQMCGRRVYELGKILHAVQVEAYPIQMKGCQGRCDQRSQR